MLVYLNSEFLFQAFGIEKKKDLVLNIKCYMLYEVKLKKKSLCIVVSRVKKKKIRRFLGNLIERWVTTNNETFSLRASDVKIFSNFLVVKLRCSFGYYVPTLKNKKKKKTREASPDSSFCILESDAFDLFVRTANYGRVTSHARLHVAVRCENTRKVQRASDVSHETETARHPGSRQGMRMGSFSS